jgi:hypothetical protein
MKGVPVRGSFNRVFVVQNTGNFAVLNEQGGFAVRIKVILYLKIW